MEKKTNWQDYMQVLKDNGIKKLYHFTDRDNLESIIKNGGLHSWGDCESKGINIAKPGGGQLSRDLDKRDQLQNYVRESFTSQHPMMYVAMQDGRISNPVILEIDTEVVGWQHSKYSNMNATRTGANKGEALDDLKKIHFQSVKAQKHFDLDDAEQPFFQAEVLVKNFIPLKYITNIGNFGIPIPSQADNMQAKVPYTAQITRNTPTAFIFLVDHSVSMRHTTSLFGEEMTMAEAAARIVNNQINELVLRCVKMGETRHYYDIAVVGYGESAYSGWQGELEGRDFVSPEELKNHPFTKITTRKETRTRKGVQVKEVEQVQWISARHDGSWTHYHDAFDYAKKLLDEWMKEHHEKDCYPPTIIHITDGEFNGASKETVMQKANELKAMFTNDGNVILFNIHFTANKSSNVVACPITKSELAGDRYAETLFELSSLLPERYNQDIARCLNDSRTGRHVAMGMNADATTLIKLMDIGTPTNISQNQ
ncbi:MAG: DarT ssDNA thymidine ADP-ribosyltransferase family protein [Bacteroidaceae bacterium]|nr:DarT ssDNA thymidine ADP-ribosyltransferase family protein [Bacteroidaceae bacterium]